MAEKKIQVIEGSFQGSGLAIAIVASRFNDFITAKLVDGAIDCLKRHEVADEKITVVWVPGAFEIPFVAQTLVESNKYDAVVCLGTVIRGETPHFDYIAAEVSKGVAQVALKGKIPVVFGVLTTDNVAQAVDRAGTKAGNKGFAAALTALEMANLHKKLTSNS